jgi:hypothetical protein
VDLNFREEIEWPVLNNPIKEVFSMAQPVFQYKVLCANLTVADAAYQAANELKPERHGPDLATFPTLISNDSFTALIVQAFETGKKLALTATQNCLNASLKIVPLLASGRAVNVTYNFAMDKIPALASFVQKIPFTLSPGIVRLSNLTAVYTIAHAVLSPMIQEILGKDSKDSQSQVKPESSSSARKVSSQIDEDNGDGNDVVFEQSKEQYVSDAIQATSHDLKIKAISHLASFAVTWIFAKSQKYPFNLGAAAGVFILYKITERVAAFVQSKMENEKLSKLLSKLV